MNQTKALDTILQTVLSLKDTRGMSHKQRILFKLLKAEGKWVPRSAFRGASMARLRELRKHNFEIDCCFRSDRSKNWSKCKPTYYRLAMIDPNGIKRIFHNLFATT